MSTAPRAAGGPADAGRLGAAAELYHVYFTGLILTLVSRRSGGDAAEWAFRVFRHQHHEKFLSSFDKLDLRGMPHAVACAAYHYLANAVGGVGVEFMISTDHGRPSMKKLAMTRNWLGLALLFLMAWSGAEAAEIRLLSTVGMQPATPDIIAQFEGATGHKVAVTYGLAAVLKSKFLEGAPADVLLLTSPIIEDLAKQGKVAPGSKIDVARSGVGGGIKAGAPKPDVGTPDALKSAVLAAKSIGYSKEGASGVAFARALERLGIAEQVKAKYKDTGTKTGEMLVSGDIELGAAQVPELMAVPGVDVVGPLPAELQTVTIFSVGLAAEAKDAEAAKAFIQFLSGPTAAPILKAKGLGG